MIDHLMLRATVAVRTAPRHRESCGKSVAFDSGLPAPLWRVVNGHICDPQSPHSVLRINCTHVDVLRLAAHQPHLWREDSGVSPGVQELRAAQQVLAAYGLPLALDVELEVRHGRWSLIVYGAGVAEELPDEAWMKVTPLLTTCATTLRDAHLVRFLPSRSAVRPQHWHRRCSGAGTWWEYRGDSVPRCPCPAHHRSAERGHNA
ncbi:hypothetical protein D5S17_35845 [Pseudonocardiaceae bacterium YIM PH 21723]|nr:hypothetical protein D5S17_35845 [Pseudonocardiaceae bacterium YIM PH 21723]